jgi:C_GCAxxG_C_C family probable redox protein
MTIKKRNPQKVQTCSSVEEAAACFNNGFSCSQAVLSSCSRQFGMSRRAALKVAGAFGGGMARMGETCGAVTGAFMIIGLKHGKTRADDNESREKTYELAQKFAARFRSKHGSIICKELLGHDISTPEGRAAVKEKKLSSTLCPKLVKDAVKSVEKLLKD